MDESASARTLSTAPSRAEDLWGEGRCLERIGALPETLVWDRESAIAGGGQPTDEFAGFCGQLGAGWIILDLPPGAPAGEPGDAQAKGAPGHSHRFMHMNFEPGTGVRKSVGLPAAARRLM